MLTFFLAACADPGCVLLTLSAIRIFICVWQDQLATRFTPNRFGQMCICQVPPVCNYLILRFEESSCEGFTTGVVKGKHDPFEQGLEKEILLPTCHHPSVLLRFGWPSLFSSIQNCPELRKNAFEPLEVPGDDDLANWGLRSGFLFRGSAQLIAW